MCGAEYIGKTEKRNAKIKWNRNNKEVVRKSECAKYLSEHLSHDFECFPLSKTPKRSFKQEILEVNFIKIMKPSL